MWHKASPWLTGVLAIALFGAAWRLKVVQTELDRIRVQAATGQSAGGAPGSVERAATLDRAVPAGPGESPNFAGDSSDISSEWEQAVPPMDS